MNSSDLVEYMKRPFPTTMDMGWKPSEGTYKDCVSLPQVGKFLYDTAQQLAPVVKEALGLWLKADRHLPRRLQASRTQVLAVQTALQAAPAEPTGHSAVTWMRQHLENAALRMLDHMDSQAKALAKLADVLKAVSSAEQRVSSCVSAVLSQESLWLQNSMMAMTHTVGVAMALVTTYKASHMRLTPEYVKARTGAALLAQHAERQAMYYNTWQPALASWLASVQQMRDHLAPGDVDAQHFKAMPVPALTFLRDQNKAAVNCMQHMKRSIREEYFPELNRGGAACSSMGWVNIVVSGPANVTRTDDGVHQGNVCVVKCESVVHDDGASTKEKDAAQDDVPGWADSNEDCFDMQALLQMMYGESGLPG